MTMGLLLVEGVPGAGKSTLLDALIRRHVAACPERRLRTVLHLTQAHTYGPLAPGEDAGTLTVAENLAHLEGIVAMLERLAPPGRFFGLVDTLHLTHCHRPGVVSWSDVAALDGRLAELGARLLFLHASPETLWRRGIEPRLAEPFMTGYAGPRWGPSVEDVHRRFVAEQESMRALLARTRMAHRSVAADGPLAGYLEDCLDFWLATSAPA